MTTSATAGYGCLWKKGTVTVAEVKSISGPSISRDTFDVSSMDSTNWKEFIAGLIDGGEVTLDLNLLPADTTHTAISSDLTATAQSYGFYLSDSSTTTWTVTALTVGFVPNAPVDDRLSCTVTYKVTGAVTFA